MKRWIILGVALSVLLAGTIAVLFGFFFTDIFDAIEELPASTAATVPFDPEPPTEPTTEATTEATTVPETTEPTEESTEETTEVTEPTEETTEPTEPVTEPPTEPTTLPPTEPPTAPPVETTTKPPVIEDQPPLVSGISANHGFVYNATTDTYLYTFGDQQERIKMASITKLFSAWVALQHMDPEAVITAGEEVKWIDPQSSRAWIYQGQKVNVTTCVQGMIIPSGNDAAYILAVATGRVLLGNPDAPARDAFDAFIAEMNAQAEQQGLTGTHFANPDGIDEPEHYTTATDVLKIAKLAMTNPIISRAAATASMTAYYVSGETVTWNNSNHLLHSNSAYYCPNTIGLKTGHTQGAGWCLVSAFDEDGTTLIIGVFGSDTIELRNADTVKLYKEFCQN